MSAPTRSSSPTRRPPAACRAHAQTARVAGAEHTLSRSPEAGRGKPDASAKDLWKHWRKDCVETIEERAAACWWARVLRAGSTAPASRRSRAADRASSSPAEAVAKSAPAHAPHDAGRPSEEWRGADGAHAAGSHVSCSSRRRHAAQSTAARRAVRMHAVAGFRAHRGRFEYLVDLQHLHRRLPAT